MRRLHGSVRPFHASWPATETALDCIFLYVFHYSHRPIEKMNGKFRPCRDVHETLWRFINVTLIPIHSIRQSIARRIVS